MQAGVFSSRSQEEVAELQKALCLLIKRAADIQDAKDAKVAAEMRSALESIPSTSNSAAAQSNQLPGRGAERAEGDNSKAEDDSAGSSGSGVQADSELITPEIDKLLPQAAHRVSSCSPQPLL